MSACIYSNYSHAFSVDNQLVYIYNWVITHAAIQVA